jgi:hypothetical protein
MKDNFADLEEPKSKGPMIVLIAFGLIGIIFVSRLFTSPSHPTQGVIESIDSVSAAEIRGAGAEDVSVRLTDGSVVLAQVANGGSLHVGDEVRVMDKPTSATRPAYEVIAKNHGTEP